MTVYQLKTFVEPVLPRLKPGTTDLIATPRSEIAVGGYFSQRTTVVDTFDDDKVVSSITVTKDWVHIVAWETPLTLPRYCISMYEEDERPAAVYANLGGFDVTADNLEQCQADPAISMLAKQWELQLLGGHSRLLYLQRKRVAVVVGEIAADAEPGWLETDHGRYFARPHHLILRELDGIGVRIVPPKAAAYEFEGLWDPGQSLIVRYDKPEG